jgi:hypothetical protein
MIFVRKMDSSVSTPVFTSQPWPMAQSRYWANVGCPPKGKAGTEKPYSTSA